MIIIALKYKIFFFVCLTNSTNIFGDQFNPPSSDQYQEDDLNENTNSACGTHHQDTGDHDLVTVSTIITNLNSNTVNNSQAAQAISALGSSGPGHSKSYFDLRLRLVSTVHTQDVYLERFISVANQIPSPNQEILLRQSLNELCYVEAETLVKFLFVILDKIFYIMTSSATSLLSQCCVEVAGRIVQKVTHLLPNQNDAHKRNRLLIQYIKYACNLPYYGSSLKNGRLFHELLLNEWLNCLNKKHAATGTQTWVIQIDLFKYCQC